MAASEHYMLDNYVRDLRRIISETNDEDGIICQVSPLAQQIAAGKSWLELIYYQAYLEQGYGVHLLHE